MTRNFLFLLLWLIPALTMAQICPLYVSGQVTNATTGAPIANQPVIITTDSSNLPVQTFTVTTNQNGVYGVCIAFNSFTNPGNVIISTSNCNGAMVSSGWQPYTIPPSGGALVTYNFQVCGTTGGTCQAAFTATSGNGTVAATNQSTNGTTSAFQSSWTLSTTNGTTVGTSSQINASFGNLSSGTYLLCLTISNSAGCNSTTCDSVVVSTGGGTGCQAAFTYTTGMGSIVTTNQSTGSSPMLGVQSTWVLSGGGASQTSSLSNPTFGNLATGAYVLCLTISDATGCQSSVCDSMWVQGGTSGNCNATFTAMPNPNSCAVQFDLVQTSGFSAISWDFGDGSSASQTTTPLHTYASSGTYTVTCTLYSSNTAICATYNMAVTVNCGGSNTNIAGLVSKSAPGAMMPADAEVYLIVYDAQQGSLTAIDTTVTDSMGYYYFGAVAAGTYYVKAALRASDPHYTGYLPTYFGGVLLWNQATAVAFGNNNNINMIGGNNPGGPGFIGGLVSQGANRSADVGDPLADLTVLLTDVNDNAIAYDYTATDGTYSFSNLAYGTYKVWMDVLNKTCTPIYVTISGASSSVNNANFDVNSTYITALSHNELTRELSIYPNPAKDKLNVSWKGNAQNATVQIVDMMGRTQLAAEISQQSNELNVAALPQGYYLLTVATDNGNAVLKFVKE